MEALKDFLWPIVAIGGLGAFIDFLIGRTGQEKAKDFLLRWWVRFDDVQWNNFGREEGLFAGHLIDKWFGQKIWSVRRIVAALVILIILIVSGLIQVTQYIWWDDPSLIITRSLTLIISFSLSMSFTKFITFKISSICGTSVVQNLFTICIMLIMNYLLLVFWTPVTSIFELYIVNFLRGTLVYHDFSTNVLPGIYFTDEMKSAILDTNPYPKINFLLRYGQPANENMELINLFSPMLRFIFTAIFIGSFVVRPLIMRPVSLVWARIVESEKPVFTLTFGGAAAFASAISEAAKHL